MLGMHVLVITKQIHDFCDAKTLLALQIKEQEAVVCEIKS